MNKSKKLKVIVAAAVTAVAAVSGASVAYAQQQCPSICYRDCGSDPFCVAAQIIVGCWRMVCE
jgi:hypothetical protein